MQSVTVLIKRLNWAAYKSITVLFNEKENSNLLVILASQFGVLVGDMDVKLLGTLNNGLSLLGADGVGDLGAENAVVHHQNFQLGNVVDDELLEVLLVLGEIGLEHALITYFVMVEV